MAHALGMTHRQLAREIDADELRHWIAYANLTGPLTNERGDLHAGIIASTIANCHSKRAWSASDFMPKLGKHERREKSQVELQHALMRYNAALGGTFKTAPAPGSTANPTPKALLPPGREGED